MKSRLLAAFLLSGAAGLIDEVVWSRRLAVLVGATAPATQAVLTVFFCGVLIGALLLGGWVGRARHGAQRYAGLELGIAVATGWSLLALSAGGAILAQLTDGADSPRTVLVALGVTAVACLPATVLMGATLPAALRAVELQHGEPLSLGRLYGTNVLGAALGALGGAFVLLPLLGVRATLLAAAGLNVSAALLTWGVGRPREQAPGGTQLAGELVVAPHLPPPPAAAPIESGPRAVDRAAAGRPLLWAALLLAGCAAILLEIVALRLLAIVLDDTVYTFALAVTAYLVGGALASWRLGQRPARTWQAPGDTSRGALVALLGAALWLLALRVVPPAVAALQPERGGPLARLGFEALVSLVVAAPAAVPTTWVFVALTDRLGESGRSRGATWATLWNGLGCALAPLASVLLLLPVGGTRAVGWAALAALLVASLLLARAESRALVRPLAAGALLVALVLACTGEGLFALPVTPGSRLVWSREGGTGSVTVEEAPDGSRRLRTNGRYSEGGDRGVVSSLRQGLLPTLLAPQAQRVLVLGVGTGITLGGVTAGLPEAQVDAVELIPEIEAAVALFSNSHDGVERLPRVALHVADARTYVAAAAAAGRRFDLVVGELFHTNEAGVGALYAREHFRAVAQLIGERGLYCQWVPLHETPVDEVKTIVRTFFRVFPDGAAWLGGDALRTPILALVGAVRPVALDTVGVAARVASTPGLARRARQAGLEPLVGALAWFVAPADALRRWAGPGPDNSDDRPIVEFAAPLGTSDDQALDNLLALAPVRRPPDGLVRGLSDGERAEVVALQVASSAFWRGAAAANRGDVVEAQAALREALAASPGYRPADEALRALGAAGALPREAPGPMDRGTNPAGP